MFRHTFFSTITLPPASTSSHPHYPGPLLLFYSLASFLDRNIFKLIIIDWVSYFSFCSSYGSPLYTSLPPLSLKLLPLPLLPFAHISYSFPLTISFLPHHQFYSPGSGHTSYSTFDTLLFLALLFYKSQISDFY